MYLVRWQSTVPTLLQPSKMLAAVLWATLEPQPNHLIQYLLWQPRHSMPTWQKIIWVTVAINPEPWFRLVVLGKLR